jgi:hypothetical protein
MCRLRIDYEGGHVCVAACSEGPCEVDNPDMLVRGTTIVNIGNRLKRYARTGGNR